MKGKTILIVDDDSDLSLITSDMLSSYGYTVTCTADTRTAYDLLTTKTFDMIILDINLPYQTGFDFCKQLRKISAVPVIFVSARTSEDDKIIGLDIGGDDYLSKPYSLKELLSRVNSLMRRTYGFSRKIDTIIIGDIQINPELRTVVKNNREISLSLKEFDLLYFLAKNKNKVLKKEVILSEVWGTFSEVELSTVFVHIRWLREKLEDDPAAPRYIKTAWGTGYSICDGEKE